MKFNKTKNIDDKTVKGFGEEWNRFDQKNLNFNEAQILFDKYFAIFPLNEINETSIGFDMGCGSGRWSKFIAPKVAKLHCIDPSSAIDIARVNLSDIPSCEFHAKGVDDSVLPDASADFGYSLGVLHHVPDTLKGIKSCVKMLKPNAPFLLYLYYAFDNRPFWYRFLWKISEIFRLIICRLPNFVRYLCSQLFAIVIYWPLARIAFLFEIIGASPIFLDHLPLGSYRNLSFYTMRTDALDRFGTRLEQRFTKSEIFKMMKKAGLKDIRFSDNSPYWCAIGRRK